MYRVNSLRFSQFIRGSPPLKDRSKSRFILHASMKPAFTADIDFSSLGLTYPLKYSPQFVEGSDWSHPQDQLPDLPFTIERTVVGKSLPVYTDYKGGRTKVITILRRCSGNIDILKQEMEKVCGCEVQVCHGSLKVDGNYRLRLKKWLAGIGF